MLLYYLPVVFVVVYYGLYYYFTRTFNYWKKQNVVTPALIPFFGNFKDFTLRRKNGGVVLQEFYNMFPNERVVGVYRLTTPSLLIRDLDIVKQIMVKDFDRFTDRGIDFSSSGLGQNMFHAGGETWRALRAQFTPIFTSGKLKSMFYLIGDCADMLMTHLDEAGSTSLEYDVHSIAQKFTISSISACAFGVNLNNFETEMDDELKYLDKLVFSPNLAMDLNMMYPGILKKLNISLFPSSVRKFFEQLVRGIILQRNGKSVGRGDFMDLILQLREIGEINNLKTEQGAENKMTKITDDTVAAQAFLFYVAGYETSSTAMTYLLYQLALNPDIQHKLREEIDSVTRAHGMAQGEITYDSLNDMKYLDKAMSETLRMYPIVDPLQRKANADYKIPGTNVVIKKDQIALFSVLSIHHDKNYYPNPEVFDPDRFDPELVGTRHSCAYMPFGLGPRKCIGMRFGSLQARLCIAKIISKYEVEPSKNTVTSIRFNPKSVILGVAENIFLNIKPRTN